METTYCKRVLLLIMSRKFCILHGAES